MAPAAPRMIQQRRPKSHIPTSFIQKEPKVRQESRRMSESSGIATESIWSRVVCIRADFISTLIAYPSLMTVNNTGAPRVRIQPPDLPTHRVRRIRWFKVRRAVFSEADGQLITQFRGRESNIAALCIVYGKRGFSLRPGLEIIVITVIKIHGLFALEREGKWIPPASRADSFGRLAGVQAS